MQLETSRPFSLDTMDLLPRELALDGAVRALDANQNETPEEQVLAVAVLFAAMSRRTGVSPEGLYERGCKVLAPEPFHRTANVQAEALRDYVGLRVMGQMVTAS